MTKNESIKQTLSDIAKSIVGIEIMEQGEQIILHQIISNSQYAILYVSLIEDEFEIEFDDDDINLDFFSSFNRVNKIIKKILKNNS